METFLGFYRLEKRSKSHGVSENSITTGIPIQMDTSLFLSVSMYFGPKMFPALKVTSCKNYWELEALLQNLVER